MTWYDKLKRKLRNFSIPNLMLYISAPMLIVFIIDFLNLFQIEGGLSSLLTFHRGLIFQGQVWRIITFLFVPSSSNILFLLFFLMFYIGIGQTLEQYWGSSSFTLYYLLGVIGTIIGGFLAGEATNTYLNLSLFFAYAYLFPNNEFNLFFFLPVKAKYLAIVDAIFYGVSLLFFLITFNIPMVVSLLISLVNFFVFFGPGFFRKMKHRWKHRATRREFRKNKNLY